MALTIWSTLLTLFICCLETNAKTEEPCGVCMKVIEDISKMSLGKIKDIEKDKREEYITEYIISFCAQQDHLETSERKMCYYLEPMLQTTSRALLMNMSVKRICKKLGKENPDVCTLETIVEKNKDTDPKATSALMDEEILEELRDMEPKFYQNLNEKQIREFIQNFHRGVIFI